MTAKRGKEGYNKTKGNLSYGGWTKQSIRRERAGKRIRDTPAPTVTNLTKAIKL